MPKKTEANSWEGYMQEFCKEIPEGKENEYVAKVLVGYMNKNASVAVPFDRKKADKEADWMMKSPMFLEQMKNNKAGMLASLSEVFLSFRKLAADGLKGNPEEKKIMNFGLELMTALGGGKEAVTKRMDERIKETYDQLDKMEKEVIEKVNPVKKQEPPVAAPGL